MEARPRSAAYGPQVENFWPLAINARKFHEPANLEMALEIARGNVKSFFQGFWTLQPSCERYLEAGPHGLGGIRVISHLAWVSSPGRPQILAAVQW